MDVGRGAGQPVRVVIVDDHPVLRSGLRALVEDADDLEVAGEAGDGADALTLCRVRPPDVVLMDLRRSGTSGIAAAVVLATELPDVRMLMLATPDDEAPLVAARRAGARGHVLSGASSEEILRAVRAVATGRPTSPAP